MFSPQVVTHQPLIQSHIRHSIARHHWLTKMGNLWLKCSFSFCVWGWRTVQRPMTPHHPHHILTHKVQIKYKYISDSGRYRCVFSFMGVLFLPAVGQQNVLQTCNSHKCVAMLRAVFMSLQWFWYGSRKKKTQVLRNCFEKPDSNL